MDEPLKLILMGTGPFAVPSFSRLHTDGHQITLVVTRPIPPVQSRGGPPPSPVRDWAVDQTLEIYDPVSINDPAAIERLKQSDADLLVVCDYGQILKPDALATGRLGGINLHGSLLPAYRGAAPVQWALLSGDKIAGVSVIHMTPRLDGGPVLCTRETEIRADEDAGQLESRLSEIGVEATCQAVEMLQAWDGHSSLGTIQDADKVTQAPRLKKSDGEIDWGRSAREIDCHVRGMSPWPIAFTHFQARANKPPVRIAVKSIEITERSIGDRSSGEIVIDGDVLIATADVMVRLGRIQPAGKKEMPAEDFFRGHPPQPGSRLF